MFLDEAQTGKEVIVKEIQAGKRAFEKLSSLGIFNGCTIKIFKNDRRGPLILKMGDLRLVIGRGIAQKIKVAE